MMKKKPIATMIISFCFAISLVAGSIDWSFLDADAQMENISDDQTENISDNSIEETSEVEETPTLEEEISEEEISEEEVPEEEVPEEEVPEEEVPETLETDDVLFSLSAESDGISAEFFNGHGFLSEDNISITKLSPDAADELAQNLSGTLSGQTAVPVMGFVLDGNISDMQDGTLDVKLSYTVNENTRLYKCSDEGYETVKYAVDEEGRLVFQTLLPCTYLFADVAYTEEPVNFFYSDEDITVTAVCAAESGIPADAVFCVDKLEEDTDAYKEAYDALLSTIELGENEELLFAPYDIYFLYDGERVEPETGMVQVNMEFHNDILGTDSEDDILGDLFCVHIKEDGEVEKPDSVVSETGMTFEVDTFSVMGAAAVLTDADSTIINACLYSDGTLVYQKTMDTDKTHGSIVKTYQIDETSNNLLGYVNDTSFKNNVKAVIFQDICRPVSCRFWFDFPNCTSLDLSNLDTSNVTDMSYMFRYCACTSLDLSNLDTSNVANMRCMFRYCACTSLDLSNFDTSNVTDMGYMFYMCQNLTSLDLSNFNTSNVTNMDYMFSFFYKNAVYSNRLTSLNLSSFDTSNVTNMSYMFCGCSNLTSLDLSNFDTSNVTNMTYMFNKCYNLTSLDLSNFDTSNVNEFEICEMVDRCNKLVRIKVSEKVLTLFITKISATTNPFNCSWIHAESNITYSNLYSFFKKGEYIYLPAGTYVRPTSIIFDSIYYGTQSVTNCLDMPINELPEPSNDGTRRFLGWFTQKAGGEQLVPGGIVTTDTYYAHWADYEYNLILKPNDGDGEDMVKRLGYHETYQLPGAIYEYPGKKLTGWNTRKDGTGKQYAPKDFVKGLSPDDGGTFTLYAQYEDLEEFVTVTFETNGGISLPAMTSAPGGTIKLPIPGRMHYTFDGWSVNEDCSDKITSATYTVSGDIVLYARWIKNPVVTFDAQGNGSNTVREVKYNTAIGSLPKYPTNSKRFCSLIGWFTEPEGGIQITSSKAVTKDTTFYAHWGWKPEFDVNGGMITSTDTYSMQEGSSLYMIEKLPECQKDGYTFLGWYHGTSNEPLTDGCIIDLSEGSVVTARYEEKCKVTVTFQSNGNSYAYACIAGESLGAFPKMTAPSKSVTGYGTMYADFAGWTDVSGKIYTPSDVFTEDTILTAQWVWKDVVLTFDADGGTNISGTGVINNKMCAAAGSTLFTLPGAKKQNYVLEGWYTEKDGAGEKLTTDTVITESTTYYAHWTSFFLNSSDTTSVYNYGAEWSNVSNSNMTNLDGVLEMHPTSDSSQTASLHIRFEINKTVENNENLVLPVGAVKIRFPKYIWRDWNGNNTGSNNLSNSLPKYPNTNSMHFSYMEDGDDYVLINSAELSGTAGLDLTIAYTVTPRNVPGGASDVNGRYVDGYGFYKGDVPVTFTIDSNLDGTAESEITKNLSVEMHTMANSSLYKTAGNILYHWNTSWGKEPADAEDYFYVPWSANTKSNTGAQNIINTQFEENECHDGTIVYQNGAQVVTRHPKALLKNAPQNGITLENTIIAHWTMKSGYKISSIVRGTTTVQPERYVTDSYRKANNYNGTISVAQANGGQETILDDKKNVPLTWHLNYSGGPDSDPTWDDNLGTYHAGERTIRIRDGVHGDVMYSSGAASSPYVWEPDTGNMPLADEDYYFSSLNVLITEFDSVQVDGAWSTQTANTEYNAQDGFDLYVRHAGSDDFVFYGHYDAKSSTHSLSFTETDIVGFEVRHDSRYYRTTAYIKAVMQLKPTNHVRMLLQSDVNKRKASVIKNSSTCDVWKTADGESSTFFHVTDNTGGNRSSARNCYSLNVSTTTQYTNMSVGVQSNVIFDAAKGTQDTPVRIGAYNSNNSSRTKKMSSGTFYNLLPAGTSVDPDTIFGIPGSSGSASNYNSYKTSKNRIDPGYFDVRFVQNWENSGRTMMVITYGLPENHPVTAGIGFYYLLHNTYENVMEHGTSVENDVAFINTTKDRVLPNSISGALSIITQKTYYQKLDDANTGNIGYAKANSSFIPISAYSWGFNKSVQTISEYERRGEVLPNNLYTYRLAYSQSENATCKGLVFFDVLEGGSDVLAEDGTVQHNDSEWHGVLQYVNTGAAASKLTNGSTSIYCKPAIYYSTKARDTFTDSDWDVTNTDTWSVTKPDNAADITAVAIDCSKNTDGTDFVMKGKQSLDMYITMRAPASTENAGRTAYNEGIVWAVHETDDDPTPQYDNASVVIRDVAPELHKTADPASGTQTNPMDVYEDDELNYTISVKNPDGQFTLNDIIVEDTIPEGLSIDYANIKVHFGNPENAVDVGTSPRVNMTKAARKLKFTVSSLMPGETAYIVIPTIVNVRGGVISNMAHITSVNGIDKITDSETTWHEAYPTVLSIKKTGVDGAAIAGARLQLFDADGNMVSEWVSSEKTEHFDVKPGEYMVHEVEAPDGYLLAEDMHVTLTKNGLMYVNGERVSPALMQDDYTKILVDKKGEDGEDVIGAQLEIYELPADYGTDYTSIADDITSRSLGNAVCAWEHTGTKEIFGVLKAGYTYVLYEKAAPDGYRKAEPIVFTANTDGSEQTVTMVDPYMGRDINVWKYGETTDNPLSGASMAIYALKKHVHDYTQVIGDLDVDWTNTSNGTKYRFVQNGSKWTSNNKGINSSTASSTWTITLEKETDVSIRYKVSSESGYDKFTLKLDDIALANAISGAGTEKTVTKTLAAGTHTLTASYSKDSSSHKNNDCAYVILDTIRTLGPTGVWKCQICGNEVTDESEAVNDPAYEINEDFEPIRWTSSTDAHTVQLDKGTYILREERAPRGWAIHDDIPFSVTLDGKITYETDGSQADDLCMIDEPSDEPMTADLSVVKMVEGNMGDKTKEFRFRLSLNDPELTEITRSMRDKTGEIVSDTVQLTDGAYEFTLAHEEWISFTLPCDTEYAVTELDGEEDGYTVESVNAEGIIADTNIAVQFTNTKNAGIPTGFIAMTSVTIAAMLSAGFIIVIILWSKAKRKNKRLKEEE